MLNKILVRKYIIKEKTASVINSFRKRKRREREGQIVKENKKRKT
jgi:hypothetical protein